MEHAPSGASDARPVRRRRVFFLAGFDPRGPTHYHATYRDEATRQSQTQRSGDGTDYSVSGSTPDGEHCVAWTVQARAAGASVFTHYHYLCWDDIARARVPRGPVAWLRSLLQFWTMHLMQGGHAASWRLARRWAWALLSMPIFLAGMLLAMALSGALAQAMVSAANGAAGWRMGTAVLAAGVTGWLGWRLALRWNQVWLAHALHGSYAWATGDLPALEQRLPEFADRIVQALRSAGDDACDEVLVVGHCMGAMLGAVVLAQVARLCAAEPQHMARLKFLTLASPMANYALLRNDAHVAGALRQLAGLDITWVDYTAPQDPLCYFLVDPLRAVGVADPDRRLRFRMRSARFDKMVDPVTMQRVRHDPLKLHFLYLLATQRPVGNDFFGLTAGPRSIDSRLSDPGSGPGSD